MINPADYKKYFFSKGVMSCLQCGFLLKGSLARANLLALYKKGEFKIYFHKDKERLCNQIGFALYSDKSRYEKYIARFREYVTYSYKYIVPKYKSIPLKLTKDEFKKDVEIIGELWYYYGFAEFPYLDLANKIGNKDTKNRLNEVARFKFKARELMNIYFFKHSVIDNLLDYISYNFLKNNYAHYLFYDELLDILEGKNFDKSIINKRKKHYAITVINGKIIKFSHKEAEFLNKKFNFPYKKNIIKGITANPGKAKGNVVVAPLLNNEQAIRELNNKMKKGDILIAETTSPDILMLCEKASAIVAEQGGLLSHAAIISREMNIPCIVQAINSTKIFKTGDIVEVDADKGIIKKIK